MPEKTMRQAAEELHAAVTALHELIEREYPSRREVERRFVRQDTAHRRWAIVLAMVVASAFISFIGTVATVSTCFLGDPQHPAACNWLPGYEETAESHRDATMEFWRLRERVAKLENRAN